MEIACKDCASERVCRTRANREKIVVLVQVNLGLASAVEVYEAPGAGFRLESGRGELIVSLDLSRVMSVTPFGKRHAIPIDLTLALKG